MAFHIWILVANTYVQKSIGPDSGIGSFIFGVCITELADRIINTMHVEEYPRPDFNEMISTTRVNDCGNGG
jgi:hypothetical protein